MCMCVYMCACSYASSCVCICVWLMSFIRTVYRSMWTLLVPIPLKKISLSINSYMCIYLFSHDCGSHKFKIKAFPGSRFLQKLSEGFQSACSVSSGLITSIQSRLSKHFFSLFFMCFWWRHLPLGLGPSWIIQNNLVSSSFIWLHLQNLFGIRF